MSTSCYVVPGFTYFRNLVCLMLITWMPTKVLYLFKCILHLGPRVTLIRHCLTQWGKSDMKFAISGLKSSQ